jgi:hypothetical protein
LVDLVRRAYVGGVRAVRAPLRALGVLGWLERRPGRRARWLRSLFEIYDFDGMVRLELAWWTFDALDAADRFLRTRPGAKVFEYGSGASTAWLARRAAHVHSVEHDAGWGRAVRDATAPLGNVTLHVVPSAAQGTVASAKRGFEGQFFDAYVASIERAEGPFDLVVIDGRAREACLEPALAKLAPGGVVLFDDTERERYAQAIRRSGRPSMPMPGLAACLPVPRVTTFVAHDAESLEALKPAAPSAFSADGATA